jgi:tetratricopeptide (TPR) repeat protein
MSNPATVVGGVASNSPTGGTSTPAPATDPSKTFVARAIDPSKPGGKALNDGLALDRAGKPREAMVQYDQALSQLYQEAFGTAAKPGKHVPIPPADPNDQAGWVFYDRESRLHNEELLKQLRHAPAQAKASDKFQELVFYVETGINRKSVAYNHLGAGHQPEALAGYRALVAFNHHFGPALYNEAVSDLKVGLPKDALKALAKALAPTSEPPVSKANVKADKDWALLPAGLRPQFEKLTD